MARRTRVCRVVGVRAGAATLAGLAAVPAAAQAFYGAHLSDRASVAGSHPAWATPGARVSAVDPHQQREIHVALGLSDPQGARAFAAAVSTPGSAQYHRFLTNAEFTERFGPSGMVVAQVENWLRGQGLRVTAVAA